MNNTTMSPTMKNAMLAHMHTVKQIPLADIRLPGGSRVASPALVASVASVGILQPISIQAPAEGASGYSLVFGARRLDAARQAGLKSIPCIMYAGDLDAATSKIIALIENLQRLDASPFEQGDHFSQLLRLGLTVAEIASRVGKGKAYVSARVSLASLPRQARAALQGVPFSVSAVAVLSKLPLRQFMDVIESRPHLATSVEAARDALMECPRLDAVPFAADCAGCEHREDDGRGGAVCLDEDCFEKKLASHVGRELTRLRTGEFRAAPAVVEKEANNFAPEADRAVFKAHRAQVLRDARIAGDGEKGEPAILLGEGGTVRPVRLVPDPHATDGRAHRFDDPAAHAAAVAARKTALAVAERLAQRVAAAPRHIDDCEEGLLLHGLAEAVAGRDLSPAEGLHVLLDLAAPKLSGRLRAPAVEVEASARLDYAARLLAVLDPDARLDDIAL